MKNDRNLMNEAIHNRASLLREVAFAKQMTEGVFVTNVYCSPYMKQHIEVHAYSPSHGQAVTAPSRKGPLGKAALCCRGDH